MLPNVVFKWNLKWELLSSRIRQFPLGWKLMAKSSLGFLTFQYKNINLKFDFCPVVLVLPKVAEESSYCGKVNVLFFYQTRDLTQDSRLTALWASQKIPIVWPLKCKLSSRGAVHYTVQGAACSGLSVKVTDNKWRKSSLVSICFAVPWNRLWSKFKFSFVGPRHFL